MNNLLIRKYKDPVLHQEAVAVASDGYGEALEKTMSEMAETMYRMRGVGLAGPQVGIRQRILVADLGYVTGKGYGKELIKMVNPEIISWSEEETKAEEGCLSYPDLAVKVFRPVAIRVKYKNPSGEELESTFADWQARIISHEIDHLNGITLYSRASNLRRARYDKVAKKKGF